MLISTLCRKVVLCLENLYFAVQITPMQFTADIELMCTVVISIQTSSLHAILSVCFFSYVACILLKIIHH